MYSNNKLIRDVADIAAQIMSGQQPVTEKLHPNQQQLDVHEPEKDELTADDFKKLRAKKSGVVKEDDTGYQDRFAVKNGKAVKHNPEKGEHDEPHHVWADSPEHAVRKHAQMNKPKTEQVEELDEVNMADLPVRKIQGRAYGSSRPEPHAVDTIKGPNDAELKKIEAEKKKKKFSEMVSLYQDKGLKSLSEMLTKKETVEEGASEAEYNAQLDVAKFKANTKDGDGAMPVKQKTTMVPKATQLSVKSEETHTTVQVIDFDPVNGVQHSQFDLADIQERQMTEPEMKKREEIAKSMKKGMAGFKDRYGDRAKNVLYATATKQAMKD